MKEFRCSCGKLLARVEGSAEIKCPRCKKLCWFPDEINPRVVIKLMHNKQYDHTKF